jgi:hypothetical protein
MKLKYRQIHLDFHNSPLIYNIGENFEPEKFAEIMKKANVNSVTFFAKCHHGMSYYKTKVGKMHPALKKIYYLLQLNIFIKKVLIVLHI